MLQPLPISLISILPNLPPLNQEKIDLFKQSILEQRKLGHGYHGLLTPVKVYVQKSEDGHTDRFWLIDGTYCFTAFHLVSRDLGDPDPRIIAEVYRDLASWQHAMFIRVDSNLMVQQRTVLEMAKLWLERDQLLASIGLRAKAGDNQHTLAAAKSAGAPIKTNKEMAAALQVSERTVRTYKSIASRLAPVVAEKIADYPAISNSVGRLQEIAEAPDAQSQLEVLKVFQRQDREKERSSSVVSSKSSAPKSLDNVVPMVRPSKALTVHPGEWWHANASHHRLYTGDPTRGAFLEMAPNALVSFAPLWTPDVAVPIESLLELSDLVFVPVAEQHLYAFAKREVPGYQKVWSYWVSETRRPSQTVSVFVLSEIDEKDLRLDHNLPVRVGSVDQVYQDLVERMVSNGDTVVAPFLNLALFEAIDSAGAFAYMGGEDIEIATKILSTRPDARKIKKSELSAAG